MTASRDRPDAARSGGIPGPRAEQAGDPPRPDRRSTGRSRDRASDELPGGGRTGRSGAGETRRSLSADGTGRRAGASGRAASPDAADRPGARSRSGGPGTADGGAGARNRSAAPGTADERPKARNRSESSHRDPAAPAGGRPAARTRSTPSRSADGRPGASSGRRGAPTARESGGSRATATVDRPRPPAGSTRAPAPPRPPAVYRRRRAVAALIALALLAGLGVGARLVLWNSSLFLVERVTVTGTTTVPEPDVLAAAAVPDAVPLVTVDTQAVADRIAALPAVASVHVGLSWPHTVALTLVERTPVASIVTGNGVQLVDAGGAVFAGSAPPDLPALTMSAAAPGDPATTAALGVLAVLPPAVRAQVRSLGATVAGPGAPGEVTFGLTDDRRVVWGTPERGSDKAAVLVPLLTQKGHVFDVSSPDLPTVRR